jgi:hypothetical protein
MGQQAKQNRVKMDHFFGFVIGEPNLAQSTGPLTRSAETDQNWQL